MNIYFHYKTSFYITKNIFSPMKTYTVWTGDTNTIFINKLLSSMLSEAHIMLGSTFSVTCHLISEVFWMNNTIYNITNTLSLYFVDECSLYKKVVKMTQVHSIYLYTWMYCLTSHMSNQIFSFVFSRENIACAVNILFLYHIFHILQ
jgi:hypothetical protein